MPCRLPLRLPRIYPKGHAQLRRYAST